MSTAPMPNAGTQTAAPLNFDHDVEGYYLAVNAHGEACRKAEKDGTAPPPPFNVDCTAGSPLDLAWQQEDWRRSILGLAVFPRPRVLPKPTVPMDQVVAAVKEAMRDTAMPNTITVSKLNVAAIVEWAGLVPMSIDSLAKDQEPSSLALNWAIARDYLVNTNRIIGTAPVEGIVAEEGPAATYALRSLVRNLREAWETTPRLRFTDPQKCDGERVRALASGIEAAVRELMAHSADSPHQPATTNEREAIKLSKADIVDIVKTTVKEVVQSDRPTHDENAHWQLMATDDKYKWLALEFDRQIKARLCKDQRDFADQLKINRGSINGFLARGRKLLEQKV